MNVLTNKLYKTLNTINWFGYIITSR